MSKMLESKKGSGTIQVVMGIVLVLLVIGTAAVPILKAVNTSTWDSTEVTVFGLSSLFLILGGVVMITKYFF